MKIVKRYLLNLLIVLDVAFNVILGGDPYETISSRAGKSDRKWACVLCKFLNWLQPGHCKDSVIPSAGDKALQNQK